MNLSIHPASQQSGACHAHFDELGHGNVGEVESSYSIYGYGNCRPDGGLPAAIGVKLVRGRTGSSLPELPFKTGYGNDSINIVLYQTKSLD